MKTLTALLLVSFLTVTHAQISSTDKTVNSDSTTVPTEVKETKKMKHKKHKTRAGDVKTNGEISTSGCETATGKKIVEGEQGYEECVRQIGTK